MKDMKVYEKPRAYIERFELSQHIASCAWDMTNLSDQYKCEATSDASDWGTGFETMFTEYPRCSATPDVFEDFCYTTGSESGNLFNS